MATLPSLPLFNLLTAANSGLGRVLQKVEQHRQIQTLLANYLDPTLLDHCQVSSYQLGELMIVADSSAWVTHLRYLTPDLLDWLKQQPAMKQLEQITCKVAPAKAQKPTITAPHTAPRALSADLKTMLKDTAQEINNPKLRAALQRIAK